MVQTVMKFLDETPSMDVKLSVIDTLRTVTEGKVNALARRSSTLSLMSFADFRRSREGSCNTHFVEHQEIAG